MNTAKKDPSQARVREFFEYDPATGIFVRIKSIGSQRSDRVGLPSGKPNKATGYVEMSVDGVKQYAHRLAWICVHGAIPAGYYIDHINGVRWDNRIENLRLANHRENLRNCKVRSDNTSGVKGVYFDKTRGQWSASILRWSLGRFNTKEEAVAARRRAAEAVYGEFARE